MKILGSAPIHSFVLRNILSSLPGEGGCVKVAGGVLVVVGFGVVAFGGLAFAGVRPHPKLLKTISSKAISPRYPLPLTPSNINCKKKCHIYFCLRITRKKYRQI